MDQSATKNNDEQKKKVRLKRRGTNPRQRRRSQPCQHRTRVRTAMRRLRTRPFTAGTSPRQQSSESTLSRSIAIHQGVLSTSTPPNRYQSRLALAFNQGEAKAPSNFAAVRVNCFGGQSN